MLNIGNNNKNILDPKKLEKKLKESEEKYRLFVENTNAAITLFDENGTYLFLNNIALQWIKGMGLNLEVEHIIDKKNLHDIFPKDVADLFLERLQRIIKSGVEETIEERVEDLDRWVSSNLQPIRDQGGKIIDIQIITQDITERKKMEEELRKSEERFRQTFESAADAILWIDPNTGLIINCNNAAETLLDGRREEIIGSEHSRIHQPQKRDSYADIFKKHIEEKGTYDEEVGVITKSGKIVPVRIKASLTQIGGESILVGIYRDIIERKKAEEDLRVKDNAIKSSINGIALADLNGNLTYTNPSFLKIWGYSSEKEVLGKSNLDFWQMKEKAAEVMESLQETGVWIGELSAIKKDGSLFDVQLSANMILDLNGKPIYMMASFIDISKRKIAEKKLTRAYSELDQIFNATVPMCVVDKNYNHIRVNDRFNSFYNLKEDEAYNKKCHEIRQGHRCFFPECTVKQIFEGKEHIDYEIEDELINGTKISYIITAFPYRSPEGEIIGVIETFMDITMRKKAEEALKESEEKYRFLFETSPFSIFLLNKNGEIRDCNINGQKTLGYPKLELIGKKLTQLSWFLSDDRSLIMENIKLLSNSITPKPFNMQLGTKDGSLIWGHIEFSFVKSGMEELIQMIIQNITKDKESEQKLIKSKEEYSDLINNISDIIFRIDLNGIIKYLSPQCYEILGDLPEELIGKNLLKNVHPDDLLRLANAIRETIESKKETNADFRYQHQNGHYIHLSARGRSIISEGKEEITGIISDISKRKKIEIRLSKSEKKYRGILQNIKEGYFEVDLQGNFIFFNDSYLDLLGYSREELLGVNYRDYMDEQGARQAFEGFNYVYKTENSLNDLQFEVIRKDGEKRFHQTSVNLIHDSRGKIIGFQGIVRDITKKRKAEELEQKFKEQLEDEVQIRTKELKIALEQQKLYLDQILQSSQIKDEFLATMSHELRTPLNAIIGFTDLLLEGAYGPLNSDQLEFVKDIKSSAEHQFEMVKDILDISNIESGKITLHLQEFSINHLIEQIKSTLKPDYSRKDLKFEIKGLKNDKLIVADPIKLKEILINLLDNAVKYTTKGKITFIFKEDKENWIFKVKDTGIGIDKKYFDIIFKEFKRVDSEYVSSLPGTGLGLSLTKKLVALHGGTISFTSKLGVGSTFIFTIPKSLSIPAAKKVEELFDLL